MKGVISLEVWFTGQVGEKGGEEEVVEEVGVGRVVLLLLNRRPRPRPRSTLA